MDSIGNLGIISAVLSGLLVIIAGYNFSKAERVSNSLHYKTIAFRCLVVAFVCFIAAFIIAF